ncbi:MAG: hypothetical protein N3D15_03715, partial [Syntrophorhabdaceae bacterium]|nr:hypothetical protein [Syntrophorhabdaceae bacterium]
FSADKMFIEAPSETTRISLDLQKLGLNYQPTVPMHIKGWVCEEDGSRVYLKTTKYIIDLKNIEQAILLVKEKLEKQYLDLKNITKPPATFSGFSRKALLDTIDLSLRDYPKPLRNYIRELEALRVELKDVSGEPEKFFDVNFDEKKLSGNYPYLESYEDDGESRIYTLKDCYTRQELKTMQAVIDKTLNASLNAKDDLQKTVNSVLDKKEVPIDLNKF